MVQTDQTLRSALDKRLAALRSERWSWWQHWSEISGYILPRRGRYLVTPNKANRGDPRNQRIIDNTATIALRTLSSGMMSGLTSPSRPWFKLGTGHDALDENPKVKLWLDTVQKRLMHAFAKSNFYSALAVVYEELGAFGTAVMLIYEDHERFIHCVPMTAGEYFLANDHRNFCNAVYREFTMTVAQVVKQFGIDNCSANVQSLHKSGQLDTEILVGHAVEENDKAIAYSKLAHNKKFRDVYWEIGANGADVLQVKGFDEFPACAVRWHLLANEPYGRSPAMDCLGDVKQLQTEQKRKAQAIDKIVNPPMIADASLQNEPATQLPGGVTYVQSVNGIGFKPLYELRPDLSAMLEDIKECQQRIQKCFYADLWLMLNNMEGVQPRNTLEIMERKGEKLLQLSPVLERMQNELLDPAIARVFGIMMRASEPMWAAGLEDAYLPKPPDELKNVHITVDYISMLAQAQKAVATSAIEQLFAFSGNLVGVNPEIIDKLNFDEAVDLYADLIGAPPKLVVPQDQAEAARQQRAQQQQQQQAAQNAMAMTQGAKTMSETNVGGGASLLQRMAGMG